MAHHASPEVQGVRDYYKVLEVSHTATPDEIRRAYRSLALQFHPDRNSGSHEAEERFKELAEAFHTLSDPDRREVYDIWGPRAESRGVVLDPDAPNLDEAVSVFVEQFSAFVQEDLLDSLELSSMFDAPPTPAPPLHVRVSLAEVATGTTKEVPLPCSRCFGAGVLRSRADREDVCRTCGGNGEDPIGVSVLVEVPAGAESGDCVRVHRFGEDDLLAVVDVLDDPRFVRAGADVIVELPVPSRRGPGSEVDVPTLTGSTRIKIPPGTPIGGALRIPGQGLPVRTRPGNGDLIVKLVADEGDTSRRVTDAAADGAHGVGQSTALERPPLSRTMLAGLGFVLGGTTFWLVGRGGSSPSTGAWMGLALTVLLLTAVTAATVFLISSLLAFLGAGVKDWIGQVRSRLAGGRALVLRSIESLEDRLRRFAVRERRHPPRPLVVQLDRLADAVEHAGEAQIATLRRLEQQLYEDAAHLGNVQAGPSWSSEAVADRLRASARHTADSTAAAPILLLVALVLGAVDSWGLRQALLPILPDADGLPFPLAVIEPAGLFAILLSVGALVSGALRQLFEPLEIRTLRAGALAPQPDGQAPLVRLAPTLMGFVIIVLQTLCFLSISRRIDLATRLQLAPYGRFAAAVGEAALPVAGAVLSLLLVVLGYGFCGQLREAFASDADGALARRLRRQSEPRGAAADAQALRAHVNELAATVEGLSGTITREFVRATGFDGVDQTIVRSVRAAAARVAERGGAFVPRGLRSLEQIAGALVIGSAGFVLLVALLGLLFDGLAGAFATAPPFAGVVPAVLPALAGALVFALGGYVLRDALFGSNHAATVLVMLPQRRGRMAAAAVSAAALLTGLVFVAWLGAAGQPIEAGSTLRSLYLVLLAAGAAAVSTNLDGWIVSAYKLGYVAVNAALWVALSTARAGLTALDWVLVVTAEAVGLLSIPGRWVRSKVFRPA